MPLHRLPAPAAQSRVKMAARALTRRAQPSAAALPVTQDPSANKVLLCLSLCVSVSLSVSDSVCVCVCKTKYWPLSVSLCLECCCVCHQGQICRKAELFLNLYPCVIKHYLLSLSLLRINCLNSFRSKYNALRISHFFPLLYTST